MQAAFPGSLMHFPLNQSLQNDVVSAGSLLVFSPCPYHLPLHSHSCSHGPQARPHLFKQDYVLRHPSLWLLGRHCVRWSISQSCITVTSYLTQGTYEKEVYLAPILRFKVSDWVAALIGPLVRVVDSGGRVYEQTGMKGQSKRARLAPGVVTLSWKPLKGLQESCLSGPGAY